MPQIAVQMDSIHSQTGIDLLIVMLLLASIIALLATLVF